MGQHLAREALIGLLLTSGLFVVGYARVWLSGESVQHAFAIALCLLVIVSVAVIFGALIPICMHFILGLDPANAGATIQVLMDVMGVTITILICDFLFARWGF